MPPEWCKGDTECWTRIVDHWLSPDQQKKSEDCRQRRYLAEGATHHQGNLPLDVYAERWVRAIHFFALDTHLCYILIEVFLSQSASHVGRPCPTFKAFALSHKGKATADIDYNPNDPPEAYSNPSINSKLSD